MEYTVTLHTRDGEPPRVVRLTGTEKQAKQYASQAAFADNNISSWDIAKGWPKDPLRPIAKIPTDRLVELLDVARAQGMELTVKVAEQELEYRANEEGRKAAS